MDNVPTMISTKDIAYLSDMFEWNYTACKKALHFSKEVQEEDIKNMLEAVSSMHKEICEEIVSILE